MKNAAADSHRDYKKFYEASLLTLSKYEEEHLRITSKKDEEIAQKDERITQLSFELDKFRRYFFG